MSTTAPVQDPNEAAETAASAQPAPEAAAAEPEAPQGDNGTSPLSSIEIQPAENGHIVTHHHKVSDRVKHMGYHEPTKTVTKGHKDLMAHLEKHTKRLRA